MTQLLFDFNRIANSPSPSSEVIEPLTNSSPVSHSHTSELDFAVLSPGNTSWQSSKQPHQNVSAQSTSICRDKIRAGQILVAIKFLNRLDDERRPATPEEKVALARFGGFGAVALRLFPDPVTGSYKDPGWQMLGEELKSLLSPEDYESAKRSTFNAFYTSPVVMAAMHGALHRLGVAQNALVLEPGCGSGNFMGLAPDAMRFIGIELDRTSGRIAQAIYLQHDIRIESFQKTQLQAGSIDAVIGNVPFASVKLNFGGTKFSLHDYFFAKSVEALKPGGVLALVTSHFTLDKKNAAIREYLADQADFLGAIRLPSDAFKQEGTAVVTDIIFFRKRDGGTDAQHVDAAWLEAAPLEIEGAKILINGYFLKHPEMVLGEWSRQDTLYGGDGYSLLANGELREQLAAAVARLPRFEQTESTVANEQPAPARFERPPPPEKHVTTGSLFVSEEGAICKVLDKNTSQPVTHGERALTRRGTKMGKRLAALIALRDAARRTLQSQNEGWPESERDATRRDLNWIYDCFVRDYGPINKTTFGQTKSRASTRRMPNLVKFKQDPDAMLVMSLEEYDEDSGRATKAAIMRVDVVGQKPKITTVSTCEAGLLVSLDQRGAVDLAFIASLYGKPAAEVSTELGDLIYKNPETGLWDTADIYLSGNVRLKLAAAELAGPEFQHHAEVLRAVQPPDLLPGEIDANLGSPWIPVKDMTAFASYLFGVAPSSIRIGHLKKDAFWSVDADYAAENSVAATSEFGTPRVNGIRLLDLALNMKTPIVYDTFQTPDGDRRVVNQEETVAAREKQKKLKGAFCSWVFDDPDRAERLVRIYNDTYNNLRLRRFDGSHLEFPGMNQTISLRPHQKDAIWRCMSSGNSLLAHAVGAGKTYVMAATGMKLHEAGLAKKPMFVVPNHMLEQFSREFMQLYPNAQLLIATKEEMTRERRKFLTAKIATGQWNGIIVTHSSFERIAMSLDYQTRFLTEQISEYEQFLCEAASEKMGSAHRNIIKAIEKQKASREGRLEDLMAAEKKDDGLAFDELGVDHLFIDEAHYFKNLETPTKMQRVAGIQTGGSQRAFDLYMKARYLDELHLGHGVTFATGTPISNTMVEMYTLQRFLDPAGLQERAVEHFDAWAATFGEVVETTEISPDGASLRSRSRFARFNNLPELLQMFRAFTDVQTAQMLALPTPELKGGKPTIIACPMSEVQTELQAVLVERYEQIRSASIDPRVDNALAITTDGRKLALDGRMISPDAEEFEDSKVNRLVKNIVRIYHDTSSTRGTQMVFCDLGVKKNAWGYSAYAEVIEKLTQLGMPRNEIATMGDASTDAKKQALFERVRNGTVRVLLGSTQKMGTGTNVQKRLAALHHLDAPWKPAEVEQREGRILRQGNENRQVEIFRYVTEGSFDAFMWQTLETKARFISQVMTGERAARHADDIGGQELSYAEVKAIASGNPAVLTLAEADAELKRLSVLKKNHTDEQFLIRRKIATLPRTIQEHTERLEGLVSDREVLNAHASDRTIIGNHSCHPEDLNATLTHALDSLPKPTSHSKSVLGIFHGLSFGIEYSSNGRTSVFLEGAVMRVDEFSNNNPGARAIFNALDRIECSYDKRRQQAQEELELSKQQLKDYEARCGAIFSHEESIVRLVSLRDGLRDALSGHTPESNGKTVSLVELTEELEEFLTAHSGKVETGSATAKRIVNEEEPVTLRARRRIESLHGSRPVDMHTVSDDPTDESEKKAPQAKKQSEQEPPADSATPELCDAAFSGLEKSPVAARDEDLWHQPAVGPTFQTQLF